MGTRSWKARPPRVAAMLAVCAAALAVAGAPAAHAAGGDYTCTSTQNYADCPVNTVPPALTQPAYQTVVGDPVSTTQGTWTVKTGTGYSTIYYYQWLRCDAAGNGCAAITSSSLTNSPYTVTSADVGHTIRSAVIALTRYRDQCTKCVPIAFSYARTATSAPSRVIVTGPHDTAAPAITLGGEMYDLRAEPFTGDAYQLEVEADDNGPAGNVAGVNTVIIAFDGVEKARSSIPCALNTDCDSDLEWTLLRTGTAVGTHSVTVTAIDWVGNTSTATFSFYLSATRAVAPNPADDPNDTGSGDDDPSGEAGCDVPSLFSGRTPVVSVARADRLDRSETTVRYRDGSYQVARCDALGRFRRSQVVAPVSVPGGTALLTVEQTVASTTEPGRVDTDYVDYADPRQPGAAQQWRAHLGEALAGVIPPTPGG